MSSPEHLKDIAQPFLTVENTVTKPFATLITVFVVYGIYIVIFTLYMNILVFRHHNQSRLYLICTILLFALATHSVGWQTFASIRQVIIYFRASTTQDFRPMVDYLLQDKWRTVVGTIGNLTACFLNALADIMLIHRCYVVWGSNKVFLCVLGVAGLVLNAIYLATSIMLSIGVSDSSKAYMFDRGVRIDNGNSIAIAVFNGLLSLSTGWRIWWITREARRHMGSSVRAKYRAMVAAILESGVLYPATLIASIVVPAVVDPDSDGLMPIDLSRVAVLMSGLAPTLIIVRVAYGQSIDNVQQVMTTSIHFVKSDSRPSASDDTGATALELSLRAQHTHQLETGIAEAKPIDSRMV